MTHTVQIQYFPNAVSESTESIVPPLNQLHRTAMVLPEISETNAASQVPFSEIFDSDRLDGCELHDLKQASHAIL